MDVDIPSIVITDVVRSVAGRDAGNLYYVIATDDTYLALVNGKDRPLDKPKRKKYKHVLKVLHAETRVAEKLRSGEKVHNSEIRRDLAYFSQQMQDTNLGG